MSKLDGILRKQYKLSEIEGSVIQPTVPYVLKHLASIQELMTDTRLCYEDEECICKLINSILNTLIAFNRIISYPVDTISTVAEGRMLKDIKLGIVSYNGDVFSKAERIKNMMNMACTNAYTDVKLHTYSTSVASETLDVLASLYTLYSLAVFKFKDVYNHEAYLDKNLEILVTI